MAHTMRAYDVLLTKSYVVRVNAHDKSAAQQAAETFMGDATDISTEAERRAGSFEIGTIDCTVNDAFEVIAVDGDG